MSKIKSPKTKPLVYNQKVKPVREANNVNKIEKRNSLFDILNNLLGNNDKFLFYFILSSCLLFSLLLLNIRISEGGDDSTYIEVAYNYSQDFFNYYYTFQAPLYPMLLSVIIQFAGINLILFKFVSIIFNFMSIVLLLKALTNKVPPLVLYPVAFLTAINATFLYYASQTYTEAFFMFLQGLLIYLFTKLPEEEKSLKEVSKNRKIWVLFGLIVFLLTITKNVAIITVPALIIYFVIQKRLYSLAAFVTSFAIFKGPFEVLKKLIWKDATQYSSQGNVLLLKDPYDPSQGAESIAGFVSRLSQNSNLYLSKRLFQILGLKAEDSVEINGGLMLLVVTFCIIGIVTIFRRRNKLLLFIAIYTALMVAGTFIALQTRWDQSRLILVFVPFILIIILYGFHEILKKYSFSVQSLYLYVIIGLLIAGTMKTFSKTAENIPIVRKNLKGDQYYGYTQDWANFLKLSEWCGKNLPEESLVVSRKAPMSFIYSKGKKFHPVYKTFSTDADTVLASFKVSGVTHVILASLRRNPQKADGNVINTIHRIIQPISQKYPEKLTMIRQEGTHEPAFLYKINY